MSNFLFNSINVRKPARNVFNLSYENDLSTQFGKLVPFMCKECLPGDKFKINSTMLVKLAPLVAPSYVRIDAYMHFFFVPMRLIYSDWEKFITNVPYNAQDKTPYIPPMIIDELSDQTYLSKADEGTLWDYLGLPTIDQSLVGSISDKLNISALPFAAYQKIYQDFYRNEFFEDEFLDFKSPYYTPNSGALLNDSFDQLTTLRWRNWAKDYFTSNLPTTQLGDPIYLPTSNPTIVADGDLSFVGGDLVDGEAYLVTDGEDTFLSDISQSAKAKYAGGLKAVNGGDSSFTINDLRRSVKLQEFNEKSLRGGNRYIEQIYSHFAVKSSDSRLQRAELLGGQKIPIMVSEIYQTSETTTKSPLGQRGGSASGYGNKAFIKKYCEEHGFIIGILSIMPHASYMQGINKMFTRMDWLDYAWPEFANLGEQSTKNYEIFMDYTKDRGTEESDNDLTFGYLPRYAEYKSSLSEVHGDFRSNLNFWHSARIFESLPSLNNSFVKFNPNNGMNRIFALNDGSDKFYCQIYNTIHVKRSLSKYGTPAL